MTNEKETDDYHECSVEDSYEDDCVICYRCKEWTSKVKCSVCNDTLFDSSCCG